MKMKGKWVFENGKYERLGYDFSQFSQYLAFMLQWNPLTLLKIAMSNELICNLVSNSNNIGGQTKFMLRRKLVTHKMKTQIHNYGL